MCLFKVGWGQETIVNDDVWDDLNTVNADYPNWQDGVTINSGVTLTINGLTLEFRNGIVLNGGAKLVLGSGTILTSFNYFTTNNVWDGILANGAIGETQFSTKPNINLLNDPAAWSGTINPNQTYVEIQDGAEIDNARTGVKLVNGAILRARGSIFKDNKISINATSHSEELATFIMDCIFNKTKTNVNYNPEQTVHIKLEGVRGLNIGGCRFKCDLQKSCPFDRGIGIFADNSSFIVGKSGDRRCEDNDTKCPENCYEAGSGQFSAGNEFIELEQGIVYQNGLGIKESLAVRNAVFSNNLKCIVSSNSKNTAIFNCSFSTTRGTQNNASALDNRFFNTTQISCPNGLQYTPTTLVENVSFSGAIAYEVYDNTFIYSSGTTTTGNIHYIKASSGNQERCRIQKNNFTANPLTNNFIASDDVIGISVEDNNTFLEIVCNSFINLGTDIKINAGASILNPVQQQDKYGVTGPAKNKFSTLLNGRFRVHNDISNPNLDYFYTQLQAIENPIPNSVNVTPIIKAIDERLTCDLKCTDFYNKVNSIYSNAAFKLFPNPANTIFTISTDKFIVNTVDIYNQMGQMVLKSSISNEIDIAQLPTGIYQVVITSSANQVYSQKLMINH